MSTAAAPARSRLPRISDAAVARARLRLVAPVRPESPLVPFVVLVGMLLALGVAGLLMLNTTMQQDSFAASRLEQQAADLTAKRQSLQIDLQRLRDPQNLAIRAKRLGMVVPANPSFVRIGDGRVLGDPQPAVPDQAMRINPFPAVKPKILAPAPRVVKVPAGTDRPVQATTARGKKKP